VKKGKKHNLWRRVTFWERVIARGRWCGKNAGFSEYGVNKLKACQNLLREESLNVQKNLVWCRIGRNVDSSCFKPEFHERHPFLSSLGRGEYRVFARFDSGFPSSFRSVSKWCSTKENPQNLKGEPIDGLNQTKIDFIDRETFNAKLRKSATIPLNLLNRSRVVSLSQTYWWKPLSTKTRQSESWKSMNVRK
jgi:hypothetical protein